MTRDELNKELDFVREQVEVFKARTQDLSKGNWMKNISRDDDKNKLYSTYFKILSRLEYLIRSTYDAES